MEERDPDPRSHKEGPCQMGKASSRPVLFIYSICYDGATAGGAYFPHKTEKVCE